MSNIDYLVVDRATGTILRVGNVPPGRLEIQTHGEGEIAIIAPPGAMGQTEIEPGVFGLTVNENVMRAHFRAKIDAEAEAVRQRFITPGAGQAMEYQEAVNQARAYLADPTGSYPMVQADVDAGTIDPRIPGPVETLAEAADLILFMYDRWLEVGSAIRQIRLTAKASVEAAPNIAAMADAAQIDWEALLA